MFDVEDAPVPEESSVIVVVVTEVVTEVTLSVNVKIEELVNVFGLVTMNLAHHCNPLTYFSFRSALVSSVNSLILPGFSFINLISTL